MGVSWTSKQDGTLDCNCDAPTAYNVFSNELLRELNPWDVVRNCPDGINVGGHIYTLTAADELDKNEPNSYTLRPKAHLRGGNFSVESFLNELKKVVLKQSTESFELYFSILNNDLLKSESYYSRCLTFLKARNEISELRESILQLEDLDLSLIHI